MLSDVFFFFLLKDSNIRSTTKGWLRHHAVFRIYFENPSHIILIMMLSVCLSGYPFFYSFIIHHYYFFQEPKSSDFRWKNPAKDLLVHNLCSTWCRFDTLWKLLYVVHVIKIAIVEANRACRSNFWGSRSNSFTWYKHNNRVEAEEESPKTILSRGAMFERMTICNLNSKSQRVRTCFRQTSRKSDIFG